MEEAEGAGVRKRKQHGEASRRGGVSEEAEVDGYRGGCYEKELGEDEGYEGIAEESVEEVMRWLETEISLASSPAPEEGFVTINGNEESCGPSFSAAASTVMASVDTRAGAPPLPPTALPWPWQWPPAAEAEAGAREEEDEQVMMVAAEAVAAEVDEEWLAELLTGGPALEV